jgi:hypothetical protein
MPSSILWARGKNWLNGNVGFLRAVAVGAALLGAAPALVACSSDEISNDGSIRGTLMVYVATMEDGTSRTDYHLLVNGNEDDDRMLVFTNVPDVGSGSAIKVWGDSSGREIIVSRFEVDPADQATGIGTSQEAIIGGSPYPSRSFAYILVNIGGGNGNYTEAQAQIDLFGTGAMDGSTKQWFLETSYGRQDISGDVVTGLSTTMNGCSNSASSQVASSLRAQVDAALGTAPQNYLWYFLTRNSSCSWAGLASVGSPDRPAKDTWYNASSSCVVLVQEPAHNFGMQHSSSLRCSGGTFANDPSGCTHDEYGDRHDPMGGGCRHTNAWQKGYQGWFGGCNRVRVNQSGTFNLLPLENACDGIQVLQVPMATTTRRIPRSGGGGQDSNDPVQFYYLELRTRAGFDNSQTSYPQVLVHVGPDYRARNQTGMHTWILDMQPSSTGANSFDGMTAGQTYTDPDGMVSFTVQTLAATGATIQVTVPTNGSNSCTDGGTLATPGGPTTCGDGGGGGGPGGAGGMGGMAGRAGNGGAAGSAGRGGMGGVGGVAGGGAGGIAGGGAGGAAGFAGGGSGGLSAGSGGQAGAGITGGTGGSVAGSPATGGFAGAGVSGAAGSVVAGAAGTATGGTGHGHGSDDGQGNEEDSGCGCRIQKEPQQNRAALFFGLAGLMLGGFARRRRTRP